MGPGNFEKKNDEFIKNSTNKNKCKCCNRNDLQNCEEFNMLKLSDSNDVKFYKINNVYTKRISDPEKFIKVEKKNRMKSPTRNMITETENYMNREVRQKSIDSDKLKDTVRYNKEVDFINYERNNQGNYMKNQEESYDFKPAHRKPIVNRGSVRFNKSKPKCFQYESNVWEREVGNTYFDDYDDEEIVGFNLNRQQAGHNPVRKRPKSADIKKRTKPGLYDPSDFGNHKNHMHETCLHYLNGTHTYPESHGLKKKPFKPNIMTRGHMKDDRSDVEWDEDENECPKVNKTKSKIKWETKVLTTSNYHKNCTRENKPKLLKKRKPKKNIPPITSKRKECSKKFNNTCYCTKPSKKPLIASNTTLTRYKKDYDIMELICMNEKEKEDIPYVPKSKFLKKIKDMNEENENGDPLEFTKQREALENAYKYLSYEDEYDDTHNAHMRGGSDNPSKIYLDDSIENFSEKCDEHQCEKIHNVNHIRNENYFDTHSTVDLIHNDCKHNCLYKYELDDRRIPRPLNADVYGTNRCIVCNKAYSGKLVSKSVEPKLSRNYTWTKMKKPQINETCRMSAFSKDSLISSTNLPSSSSTSIVNNKVIISDNDTVEIKVPNSFDKLLNEMKPLKFKPVINPQNTFALRYQKGVL